MVDIFADRYILENTQGGSYENTTYGKHSVRDGLQAHRHLHIIYYRP